jgi:hypothetical protein
MANKERLEELARQVENYERFDQRDNDHCVVGIAARMVVEATNSTSPWWLVQFDVIAEFFDISINDVDALFLAEYGYLGIKGLEDAPYTMGVTREYAAHVIRQIITRG